MTDFQIVEDFIKANIFYTEKWDELPDQNYKQVIVNNSESILYRELPHHFNVSTKPIPLDILAEQCLHLLEFDDSHRRAEMGVSYFMASGLYLSFDKNFKDRSVAKTILHRYSRRKVGRTVIGPEDTYSVYR